MLGPTTWPCNSLQNIVRKHCIQYKKCSWQSSWHCNICLIIILFTMHSNKFILLAMQQCFFLQFFLLEIRCFQCCTMLSTMISALSARRPCRRCWGFIKNVATVEQLGHSVSRSSSVAAVSSVLRFPSPRERDSEGGRDGWSNPDQALYNVLLFKLINELATWIHNPQIPSYIDLQIIEGYLS